MSHFIDFKSIGRRGECRDGDSLLAFARLLGVDLVNACGGEITKKPAYCRLEWRGWDLNPRPRANEPVL